MADSERRKATEIRRKDAPLSASSRSRLRSSRDHAFGFLCLLLYVGRKNLPDDIVTPTSSAISSTVCKRKTAAIRSYVGNVADPSVLSAPRGDAQEITSGVTETPIGYGYTTALRRSSSLSSQTIVGSQRAM